MPYSHVTRTKDGAGAIAYCRDGGEAHSGTERRNEFIAGVNMLPDNVVPFEKQMQIFWNMADPRHVVQVDRFIVSFHPSELDPAKPEDYFRAMEIGCEIARTNAPDCQSCVWVQGDGVGKKVHIHIITNDVRMSDGKGLESIAYAQFNFRKLVDRICSKYFTLAQPEAAPERVTQAVRGRRMENEKIREENDKELGRAAAEGREPWLRSEIYIWEDDLRARVKEAAREAWDEESFARQLQLRGVELAARARKDGSYSYLKPASKTHPTHYTYELVDVSGFEPGKLPNRKLKCRSHKLGADYRPEAIAKLFRKQPEASREAIRLPDLSGIARQTPQDSRERPQEAVQEPSVSGRVEVPGKPGTAAEGSRRPAQAPGKPEEKPKQPDPELERARQAAMMLAWPLFARFMGWDPDEPWAPADGEGEDGREEARRRRGMLRSAWGKFERWRVDRRKKLREAGGKLAPIYGKDKATGRISVDRDSLLRQFSDFLQQLRAGQAPSVSGRAEAPGKPGMAQEGAQEAVERPPASGRTEVPEGPALPGNRPRKPAQAPGKPEARPQEKPKQPDPELERAKQAAMRLAWPLFAKSMGWDPDGPWKSADDPWAPAAGENESAREEIRRRGGLWRGAWSRFELWRIGRQRKLREIGETLAPIYDKDKATGRISVIRDSLLGQFSDFLRQLRAEQERRRLEDWKEALETELRRGAEDREYDG